MPEKITMKELEKILPSKCRSCFENSKNNSEILDFLTNNFKSSPSEEDAIRELYYICTRGDCTYQPQIYKHFFGNFYQRF